MIPFDLHCRDATIEFICHMTWIIMSRHVTCHDITCTLVSNINLCLKLANKFCLQRC